jgi:hypothetical protein
MVSIVSTKGISRIFTQAMLLLWCLFAFFSLRIFELNIRAVRMGLGAQVSLWPVNFDLPLQITALLLLQYAIAVIIIIITILIILLLLFALPHFVCLFVCVFCLPPARLYCIITYMCTVLCL